MRYVQPALLRVVPEPETRDASTRVWVFQQRTEFNPSASVDEFVWDSKTAKWVWNDFISRDQSIEEFIIMQSLSGEAENIAPLYISDSDRIFNEMTDDEFAKLTKFSDSEVA